MAEPVPGPPLDARLAKLSPAQRALLEQRLMQRRSATAPFRGILRRRPGDAPLSYSQELLWLLHQLTPHGYAYNSPEATRLEGRLDVEALRGAVEAVIARNEILRTTYRSVDGRPLQVVQPPPVGVPLPCSDLSSMPIADRDRELAARLREEAERPFDLEHDLVLRASLFRLAPDDHVLLVIVHHIAVDGWSKRILWHELTTSYADLASGRPLSLAEPAIQYADYATWHRAWLDGGVLADQLAYWTSHLAGAPALLDLPTDRPRPAVRSDAGAHSYLMLDPEVLDGLRTMSREAGGTLFMALVAAFATLLSRYSGQEEVVVGTPVAGRNRVEIEQLVGYFMNTLALRVDLTDDPSFRELLDRTRANVLGAFAHQEVPFEKVVAASNPERDLSRTPVFQAMLVLQNQRRDRFQPLGLTATPVRHERPWSKFDLTIGMGEHPEGLNTSWEYSTDLFDASTIERMMGHFRTLAEGIVRHPEQPISTLPLITDAERRTLTEWSTARPIAPGSASLHGLFEQQVDRNPEAAAVQEEDRSLTYVELERRANQLAHRLRELGVGPDVAVGIRMPRSISYAVSALAVLKAGGACLPLDADHPPSWQARMLREAGARIVIIDRRDPTRHDAPDGVVLVDLDGEDVTGQPLHRPGSVAGPDDVAYVIFTSGSTGTPKGVELTHRGLANHAATAVALYGLTPADRVLQLASIGFDLSIEELFPIWAAGGTVVVRTDAFPMSGSGFSAAIERHAISVLDLPTAFWHTWVHDLDARQAALPRGLRLVVVGGEKAGAEVFRAWHALEGRAGVRWINTYGPTEASVIVSAHEPSEPPPAGADLPIGGPVAGSRLLVLDAARQPVPIGVPGDLCIAGPCLARGYRNQPRLTAERFVPDPSRPGQRLYLTGDRARWRSDGTLEFRGRRDDQLKVRGFRVEPGEVEAALDLHPAVQGALVTGRTDGQGGQQLVAHVVASAPEPTPSELQDHVRELLPAFMVPSRFVVLREWPLTANGKIDRGRLPEAEGRVGLGSSYRAPTTPDEVAVAAVWSEVLGVDTIGVDDDFFRLGGHSLLAMRVVSRVGSVLGIDVGLRAMFEAPTVAGMTALLRAPDRYDAQPSAPKLMPIDRSRYRVGGSGR